jgi:hypothetical protein
MTSEEGAKQSSVQTFDESLRRIVTVQRLGIVMIIITVVLLFRPLFLPIRISPSTQDFYNRIEAIHPGQVVVFSSDMVPGDFLGGRRDIYKLVINDLIAKKAKILFHPTMPGWSGCTDQLKTITNLGTVVYGTDYVFMPYVAGEEMAWASFAADIKGFYKTDFYGADLNSLPMMTNVNSMRDVNLCVVQFGVFTWGEMFVRQWPTKYGVDMITMALASTIQNWYGTYVKGNLDLDLGFAEYESLRKVAGEHILRMDARNVNSLLIIGLIIVGTALYWASPTRQKARTAMGV